MCRLYLCTCLSCDGAYGHAGHTVPPCQSSELSDSSLSPQGAASPGPAAASHFCAHTQKHTHTKQLKW